ncbi:tRNA methyltransferase complex subunit Cpd1 [Auriculariales sp. MPI-PUGE-AT-0066]|nr:tRNA methyltransferase complex subunit Cpd1 [Auriculariales sp. MPI-PUGE-AT-0066]
MWSTAPTVAAGDTVIVWQTRENIQHLVVEPGKELNNRFGVYSHVDLVGVPYGSKVASRNRRGFIHVLRPTPELWTLALPHRTQILYLADIAFVTARLNIRPGSVVVEAGTGSASFSHALARTIGPTGKLHTFEFHALRAEKAKEEFERHGMIDAVVPRHRNVCKDGFGEEVTNTADAVFLDLPAPWDATDHAFKAMRKDKMSRICCFSPCIEQVLRTVTALNDSGFTDIELYEVLLTPQEVTVVPEPLDINHAIARLKAAEVKKEDRRLKQVAKSAEKKRSNKPSTDLPSAAVADQSPAQVFLIPVAGKKRLREESSPQPAVDAKRARVHDVETVASPKDIEETSLLQHDVPYMCPVHEVRGHTSYLTFACIRPALPPHFKSVQAKTLPRDQIKNTSATPAS